ncbi:MAG: alpha-L-rhamnosidase [Chloroflexi bacterium]|nr:alpha-L-rhamnosidase [Chloroflexota bacterium]
MTSRILIPNDPFIADNHGKRWREQGLWPCHWISCPGADDPPFVTAYRLIFTLERSATFPIHVTADERYELFLDGQRIGRGSERGDPDNWFFETYELTLTAGEHTLVARTWALGDMAPIAQMSVRPGFLLCAPAPWRALVGTGVAAWEARVLEGYRFYVPEQTHWRGARVEIDGRLFAWGFKRGEGEGWRRARVDAPGIGRVVDYTWHHVHRLRPATLPPMVDEVRRVARVRFIDATNAPLIRMAQNRRHEAPDWQALLDGANKIVVPARTIRRVLIDMNDYYCFYPELVVSGGLGGRITIESAESLYQRPDASSNDKGDRNVIDGKYFFGVGDCFLPDGGEHRRFEPLWWQAGRYWQLLIETEEEPLTIHDLIFRETRYPLSLEAEFMSDDAQLADIQPMLVRAMQLCSHETYYDAPYYEELMYAGDARLEMLTSYVMRTDDRLQRKAITLFDSSRLASGMTQARYPSRETQVIPPFALWWVFMLHDYAYWRDDTAFIRRFLPGMRATLEGFQRFLDDSGLLYSPEGWNFMDWLPEWDTGIPPHATTGRNGLLNWQLIYALTIGADLENLLGEPELEQLWRRRAQALAARTIEAFWDESRGLLAEDETHTCFSEHSQAIALLSGLLDPAKRARVAYGLRAAPDLLRTTYYFSHYLFEAYRALGWCDLLHHRLQNWRGLLELGLKTTPEMPEPTRSDCHAWSAHPFFHYFATILGVRPGGMGFRTVEIRPLLGHLQKASGRMPHPRGEIQVAFRRYDDALYAEINLPEGVSGELIVGEKHFALEPGRTTWSGDC